MSFWLVLALCALGVLLTVMVCAGAFLWGFFSSIGRELVTHLLTPDPKGTGQ